MESIKFKTNIHCSGCVAKATPFLDNALGKGNWDVDYKNPEKVLSVIGEKDKDVIVRAVEEAGYRAESLS